MRQALVTWCLVAAAAVSAPGCSSVMSAENADVATMASKEIFGDIERLQFSKQVQVALPASGAVADVSSDGRARERVIPAIAALSEDRSTWTDVNSVFLFDDDAAARGGARFEDLRAAASRQRSDLLLVVRRTERERATSNVLCVFNLLLVPMLFLPTSDVRTTFDVHAAVVDVRNGLVYTTYDDQVVEEFSTSVAGRSGNVREALDGSWDRIVARMKARLAEKLRTVAGSR